MVRSSQIKEKQPEGVYSSNVPPAGPVGLVGVLTAREIEIAQLVGEAKRNKEIAQHLCLSQQTVEGHLRNIYAKLEINSRVELALLVRDLGFSGTPRPWSRTN